MKPELLIGLVKRFYPDFNMRDFENRLKLQKIIYILQDRGLNLGYTFDYYLYGPYSTDLTRSAFQVKDFGSVRIPHFTDPDKEQKFKEILSQLNPYKNDVKWLECASSILLLSNMGYAEDGVKRKLERKITSFDKAYINTVWQDLKGMGWLKNE